MNNRNPSQNPSFSDYLQKCFQKASSAHKTDFSYWSTFSIIVDDCWLKPYSKDTGEKQYVTADGIFDETTFPMIAQFFKDNSLVPDTSFLLYNVHSCPIHIKFFLWHHDVFEKSAPPKFRIPDKEGSELYQSDTPSLLNYAYRSFIQEIPKAFIKTDADLELIVEVLSRASCDTFFYKWHELDLPAGHKKEYSTILLDHYVKRVQYVKRMDANLFKVMQNNNNALNRASTYDNVIVIKQLIELNCFNNDHILRALEIAFHNNSWETAFILLTHFTVPDDRLKSYLLAASEAAKFALCDIIIEKYQGITYSYNERGRCALNYAIEHNELKLSGKLLNKCGDSIRESALVSALGSSATLAWLLLQKNIHFNKKHRGITLALYAMQISSYETFAILLQCQKIEIYELYQIQHNASLFKDFSKKSALLDTPAMHTRNIQELLDKLPDDHDFLALLQHGLRQFYSKYPEEFHFDTLLEPIKKERIFSRITYQFIEGNIDLLMLRNETKLFRRLAFYASSYKKLDDVKKSSPEAKTFIENIEKTPDYTWHFTPSYFLAPHAGTKRKSEAPPEEVKEPDKKKMKVT